MYQVHYLFFKEINTFIQQGGIKLIKVESKYIYNVTKDFGLKSCSFECSINQKNLHIRMISEDHVSNDAENSALITGIKQSHFQTVILTCIQFTALL